MKIEVRGRDHLLIFRKGVKFYDGGRVKLEDERNVIDIGENSDFVDCFFAVSDYDNKVIVGKDCMFSNQIVIRTSDVHSILNTQGKRTNCGRDVIIGDRVWVAYGATILKGTNIGDDSIIGTQSVVAGLQVPAGSVVAGNPAKIVKQGIHWCRERLRN